MKLFVRSSFLAVLLFCYSSAHAGMEVVAFFTTDVPGCSVKFGGDREVTPDVPCSRLLEITSKDTVSLPLGYAPQNLPLKKLSPDTRLEPAGLGKYNVHHPKEGFLKLVMEVFGLKLARAELTTTVATRGRDNETRVIRPGNLTTLLPEQKITFSWCGDSAKRFVIRDPELKIVYAQPVRGLTHVEVWPQKLRLQHGVSYSWEVEGSGCSGQRLQLLEEDAIAVVRAGFKEIDKNSQLNEVRKTLAKAFLLQQLTEASPEEVNLQWLAYELLEGLKPAERAEKLIMQDLKEQLCIRPCNPYSGCEKRS